MGWGGAGLGLQHIWEYLLLEPVWVNQQLGGTSTFLPVTETALRTDARLPKLQLEMLSSPFRTSDSDTAGGGGGGQGDVFPHGRLPRDQTTSSSRVSWLSWFNFCLRKNQQSSYALPPSGVSSLKAKVPGSSAELSSLPDFCSEVSR